MTCHDLIPARALRWIVVSGAVIATGCAPDLLGLEAVADLEPQLFVTAVNEHRAAVGCPALEWNDDVARVAQDHSDDMVERSFFDHTNPDGDSPFDRLSDAGISYNGAAENIAYGYTTAEEVLAGWLGSDGHRANIESCALTEHGVGLNASYWTHVLIAP